MQAEGHTYQQPMLREDALQDKVIIVTGGGTGLGKSMARYFSVLGAKVVITSRREEVLKATAEEIQAESDNEVFYVPGDVREIESVRQVVQQTHDKWGRIDGLVNNAAGNFISPTERLSHRAFQSVIGIVLQGTVNFTLETGQYFIKHQIPGNILNIVTTYAWTGSGYTVPSATAKAGVLAMTRSLAVEWGRKYKIRSNAIAPGPFPTKGAWERLFPEQIHHLIDPANRIPLQRIGDHQELANLAGYLMSDFSAYINGEVITIDGGEWLDGAGQFSGLHVITDEMWDMLAEARMKKRK